jgi:hypothetical protein
MTSTLEILDSAVKIGLGALITAVSGLVVSSRSQRHELRKAANDDRRGLLRAAAKLVEEATGATNLATYVLANVPDGKGESTRGLIEAINKLNEARSLAVLSGARVLSTEIATLRGGIESLCRYLLATGMDYSIPESNRLVSELNKSWPIIYSQFEAEYAKAQSDA